MEVVALVAIIESDRVDSIGRPCVLVIIDMGNEHTTARQFSVEAYGLTVLQKEIFVAILWMTNQIGRSTLCQRRDVLNFQRLIAKLHRREPPTAHFFVSRITGRQITVIIVGTVVHQVPCAQSKTAFVLYVIEIGEAHAVREFMTESANACNLSVVSQLIGAGIGVDLRAMDGQRLLFSLQTVHHRPDQVVIGFVVIILAISGEKHEDFFCLAVTVPVITREVNAVLYAFARLNDHLTDVGFFVGSIITVGLGHHHWAGHIKIQDKPTLALCFEIVANGSLKTILVIVFRIGYFLVERNGI